MTSNVKKEEIAKKNDQFRRTFVGGKVMLTSGVESDVNLEKVIEAVKKFEDFTEDTYGEHDFGKITIDEEDYFFKIDYYDADYKYFEVNGLRLLTIMRSEEY